MGTTTRGHYFLADSADDSPVDLIREAFIDVADDLDPPTPEELVEALKEFGVVFPIERKARP